GLGLAILLSAIQRVAEIGIRERQRWLALEGLAQDFLRFRVLVLSIENAGEVAIGVEQRWFEVDGLAVGRLCLAVVLLVVRGEAEKEMKRGVVRLEKEQLLHHLLGLHRSPGRNQGAAQGEAEVGALPARRPKVADRFFKPGWPEALQQFSQRAEDHYLARLCRRLLTQHDLCF